MNLRYTKHQVARGALPDAETAGEIHLFKKVSLIRATYQIRLLLFRAFTEGKTLVLHVPHRCVVDLGLQRLLDESGASAEIRKVR